MNWKDLKIGSTVYHTIMTHWGKGIVERIDGANYLEAMFEKGNRRIVIRFEGREGLARLQNRDLRKTPNKKRIREMVEFYKGRGVKAINAGDRLIIPETNGKFSNERSK